MCRRRDGGLTGRGDCKRDDDRRAVLLRMSYVSGGRVPEGADREHGELSSEGRCFPGQGEDTAKGEPLAESLGEEAKPPQVLRSRSTRSLDFHSDDTAVGMLEHEVDLQAAAVTEMAECRRSLRPGELAYQFGGDQCFEQGTDGGGTGAGESARGGALEVGGETDIGDEQLGPADNLGAEIRGPGRDEAEQERRFEAGEVAAHRTGRNAEIRGDGADVEFGAGPSGTELEQPGKIGEALECRQFRHNSLHRGLDVAVEP